jgi:hypothetical protein
VWGSEQVHDVEFSGRADESGMCLIAMARLCWVMTEYKLGVGWMWRGGKRRDVDERDERERRRRVRFVETQTSVEP